MMKQQLVGFVIDLCRLFSLSLCDTLLFKILSMKQQLLVGSVRDKCRLFSLSFSLCDSFVSILSMKKQLLVGFVRGL